MPKLFITDKNTGESRDTGFFVEEVKEASAAMIAGVQRVGKSMHSILFSFKSAKKQLKNFKLAAQREIRKNRIKIIQETTIENLIEKDHEELCKSCELNGTFCEGRRCEWQAETFFEDKDWTNSDWRHFYYKYYHRSLFQNLSLRNKLKLLKP